MASAQAAHGLLLSRSSMLVGLETLVVASASTQPGEGFQPPPSDLIPVPREPHGPAGPGPDSALRPMMLLGPFRLLQRLGHGAQGEVWKARRTGSRGELVALKVLNRDLVRSPNRLAQFRHEAERGARLAGPALLQVLESGQSDNYLYMAMPLIEGTTLQQVIRNRRLHLQGHLAEPVHRLVFASEARYLAVVVKVMAAAARALGRIHDSRIVHRDIKPANILLDCRREYGVYLCDLGLGRDLEHATTEQMRDGAGTPMYMAPERLLKAPADEKLSDIYSLGVTLFETATLDRPFQPPESLPRSCLPVYLATSVPRTPRSLKPGLPREVEAAILKAMARDPRQRHPSADEFAAELERIAGALAAARPGVMNHAAHRQHHPPHALSAAERPIPRTGTD